MASPKRHDQGRSQTRICGVCGDEIGLREDGEVFVACYECGFPVCRACYEYERSDGHQCCPQCNRRFKRHKGCPRVAGDEENGDGDDFEDEFQINKNNKKEYPDHDQHDSHHQKNVFAPSENGDYNPQQWHPNGPAFSSIAGSVVGKDLEGEKDMNNVEWKERVEKWKAKQAKRGLVSKDDDGANDQGEEDDYLYEYYPRSPHFLRLTSLA